MQPLRFVNFEDELENLESVQKSSNSRTCDVKDDSDEELSDIVSLQSITLTNDSVRLSKSQPSNLLEISKLTPSVKSKSLKSSDSISSANKPSIKTESKATIKKEVIRVRKTRRAKHDQKDDNFLHVTIENLSESSDEDNKNYIPFNSKDDVPM